MLELRLKTFLCGHNIKSLHFQVLKIAIMRDVMKFRGGTGEVNFKHICSTYSKVMKGVFEHVVLSGAALLCKLSPPVYPGGIGDSCLG